jgi:hypothetical protein
VRDAPALVKRADGFLNAGNLPLVASAARNERLRPVLFASFLSRFLIIGSMRTLTVVEDMVLYAIALY